MLFLLFEARFGSSTCQNYDGILRNQLFSTKLGPGWRTVMGLTLALPLVLSIAYKTFTGGHSSMTVDVSTFIGMSSYYGMFAPPRLQALGENTGVSLFSNATLPFAVASSAQDSSEPHLPAYAQPYGFNILLLNNESAAMLDVPQPTYISTVQTLLAIGESWNISAPVLATIATLNHSQTIDPDAYECYLDLFCTDAMESSGAYTHMSMMNDWQLRQGTWSITRGGMQLVDGSCNGTMAPADKQQVILHGAFFLGVWYMSSLVELLGPFATTRNQSVWTGLSIATGVAAMVWSRIISLYSPLSEKDDDVPVEIKRLTLKDAGLIHPVNDTAKHIHPTLRKPGLLYFLLTIQPLLNKDFGLISILSGVDRDSLNILAGAALSGQLKKNVKLVMRPFQDDKKGGVEYLITLPSSTELPTQHQALEPGIIYH
ncbi:MAG: hypothetical protein Q9170_002684 [Blastenia crenularia]